MKKLTHFRSVLQIIQCCISSPTPQNDENHSNNLPPGADELFEFV